MAPQHEPSDRHVYGQMWEGVHFRFSDETAVRVGTAVARHDLRRLWRLGLR